MVALLEVGNGYLYLLLAASHSSSIKLFLFPTAHGILQMKIIRLTCNKSCTLCDDKYTPIA